MVMETRWLSLVCLNLSLLCQVLSIGFGKQAAIAMPRFSVQAILVNEYYLLSMLCLVLQSIFWPIALRRYPLSFAYCYMSISYVAILVMSRFVFLEPVSKFNVIGAVLILVGVNMTVFGEGTQRDG